jgi:hypothetical protein
MEEQEPGYDDWFDEPEPPTQEAGRSARDVYDADDDVWVLPGEEGPRRPRGGGRGGREIVIAGRTLSTNQAAILAACALAVLLAILAVAGVFSSGKSAVPPISTPTTVTVTTPASTPTVTAPAAQAPTTTLKPGDTGGEVKTLQRALTAVGFSPGKADGFYGSATQTAVKQFQASKGLTADGIVGPQTLTALQNALSG